MSLYMGTAIKSNQQESKSKKIKGLPVQSLELSLRILPYGKLLGTTYRINGEM